MDDWSNWNIPRNAGSSILQEIDPIHPLHGQRPAKHRLPSRNSCLDSTEALNTSIARGQTWPCQPLPVSTVSNTGRNLSNSNYRGLDEEEGIVSDTYHAVMHDLVPVFSGDDAEQQNDSGRGSLEVGMSERDPHTHKEISGASKQNHLAK